MLPIPPRSPRVSPSENESTTAADLVSLPSESARAQGATKDQQDAASEQSGITGLIADRYACMELLGTGGFGSVYRALDLQAQRVVALKMIRLDITNSEPSEVSTTRELEQAARRTLPRDSRVDFLREEYRRLTQIHHPSIAEVYEFGHCDQSQIVFLAQELVAGTSLREFAATADEEQLSAVFLQLLEALDYLHTLGLVHGDIKPSNILVNSSPKATTSNGGRPLVKLIDFGLARNLRSPTSIRAPTQQEPTVQLHHDEVAGSPGYSSPEWIRGETIDERTDLYSLASSFLAAVTGTRPFVGTSFAEVLPAQLAWQPENARVLVARCGRTLTELIAKMLAPKRSRRPRDANAAILALKARDRATSLEDTSTEPTRFAQQLVDSLPFVDRGGYCHLLVSRATQIVQDSERGRQNRAISSRNVDFSSRLIRMIIVEAVEGMGKQRLFNEARREIQLAGIRTFQLSCWNPTRVSLGAFAPVVIQLYTALASTSPIRARYARLLAVAVDPSHLDGEAVEQLGAFLCDCANVSPFVIFISDIHRAADRLAQISAIARTIAHQQAPCLLCLFGEPQRFRSQAYGQLVHEQLAEQWTMRPLAATEATELLEGVIANRAVAQTVAADLMQQTGGHPHVFREGLRILIEQGRLRRLGSEWEYRAGDQTESLLSPLTERCVQRLQELGPIYQRVASTLYLLDTPIGETIAAHLADISPKDSDYIFSTLESEGLVSRTPCVEGSLVGLAHAAIRSAVERDSDQLRENASRLSSLIEARYSHDPVLSYARARLAAVYTEGEEGLATIAAIARELLESRQFARFSDLTLRSIARLRKLGGLDSLPRLRDAYLAMVTYAPGLQSDPDDELEFLHNALLVAEIVHDEPAQFSFWLRMAQLQSNHRPSTRLATSIARATDLCHRLDRTELKASLLAFQARVLLGNGQLLAAQEQARIALAMSATDQDPVFDGVHCKGAGTYLLCLAYEGQQEEALAVHRQFEASIDQASLVARCNYYSDLAVASILANRPETAHFGLLQLERELRSEQLFHLLALVLQSLGDICHARSDERACEVYWTESLRLAQRFEQPGGVALVQAQLARHLAARGLSTESSQFLTALHEGLHAHTLDEFTRARVRHLAAQAAYLNGQVTRACRELSALANDLLQLGAHGLAAMAQSTLQEAQEATTFESDAGSSFPEFRRDSEPETDLPTVKTKRPVSKIDQGFVN